MHRQSPAPAALSLRSRRAVAFALAAVALLQLGKVRPSHAFEGERQEDFGTSGVASWYGGGGDVTVADVATTEFVAYGVGTIELPSEGPALHWSGFNRFGSLIDSECAQASDTLFTFATSSHGRTAIIDSSGNLLVGGDVSFLGTESTRRALVSRFDLSGPGCHLDTTYSGNGWAMFDDEAWCDTESCEIVDMVEITPRTGAVLAPRVIALVREELSVLTANFRLLALTSSGAVDTGFSGDGWRAVSISGLGALSTVGKLAVDGRGGLHVAVSRWDPEGDFDLDVVVVQFTASGAVAEIAGGQPILIEDDFTDDQDDPVVADIAIAPNGDRLVSYAMTSTLAKMKQRFAGQGWSTSTDESTRSHQVVYQGNKRAVTAYDFVGTGLATNRLLTGHDDSLAKDTSWGPSGLGRSPYDISLGGDDTESVVELTLWNGRPLLAGTAADDEGTSGFLLLAESEYVHADGFEQGTPAYWSDAVGMALLE